MLNQVILVGRLTAIPEIIEIEGSKKVTTVILAVNRNFKNADGLYDTDFMLYRKTIFEVADEIRELLKKEHNLLFELLLQRELWQRLL